MAKPQRKSDPKTSRAQPRSAKSRAGSSAGRWLPSVFGFFAAAGAAGAGAWALGGCDGEETAPPPAERSSFAPADTSSPEGEVPNAEGSGEIAAAEPPPEEPSEPEKPRLPEYGEKWDGKYLGVSAFQTPVYPTPRFSERIGYIRKGGTVPVTDEVIQKDNCKQGWYKLADLGYVCGKYASTNLDSPGIKLGIKPPDLETVVPYKYAYNRFHGTPLYRSVPSKEDMLKYEPYLEEAKKKAEAEKEAEEKAKAEAEETKIADAETGAGDDDGAKKPAKKKPSSDTPSDADSEDTRAAKHRPEESELDAPTEDEVAESEEEKAWWEDDADVQVTLKDLEAGSDSNLAKRMVKGFFVAVDKTFGWNNRLWYKTTGGLVAPTDRMYINKAPDHQGIPFPEGAKAVAFIKAGKANKYSLDGSAMKKGDELKRFAAFGLTGETKDVESTTYRKTQDGFWIRAKDSTITEPGPRPEEVGENEKWVDVNIDRKTLVAFEGDKPVYAALISPGKRSSVKAKNHATPTGKWRIREKHITVTMDGDGAAGDLPYSIEDVPYVAYYKGSYALHGAFWHNNFGHEMSHGCVNLAPLDAKEIFFWADPQLPRGWHAVWSTEDNPGTMVVVHRGPE